MTEEVETVGIGDSVMHAARRMRELDIGFLPVCQSDGTPVGTVTDRDIVLRVVAEGRPGNTAVQDVMSTDLVCCRPDDDVEEAERLMRVNQVSRVLVLGDDGRVAGVISLADITRADGDHGAGKTLADVKEAPAPQH